jgi:hypothetical protein
MSHPRSSAPQNATNEQNPSKSHSTSDTARNIPENFTNKKGGLKTLHLSEILTLIPILSSRKPLGKSCSAAIINLDEFIDEFFNSDISRFMVDQLGAKYAILQDARSGRSDHQF